LVEETLIFGLSYTTISAKIGRQNRTADPADPSGSPPLVLLLIWRFQKWLSCSAQAPKWAAQTPFSSAHTDKNLEGTLVTDKFWNALRMSTNAVGIFITDGIPAHSDSDTRVSYRVYVFYAYIANGNSSQTLAVKMAFVIYVSNFATSLQ